MRFSHVVINYDEIILKGKNRPFFERLLMQNIVELLDVKYIKNKSKEGGRIILEMVQITDSDKIKEILRRIPGISNFYFSCKAGNDITDICKKTIEIVKSECLEIKHKTFKIITKRSNKNFALKSSEVNALVGEYVLKNSNLRVDIHKPDVEIGINIGDKKSFIFTEKITGVGGLPVGSSGNAICLLSGGIDSPVAAYMMAKRGLKVIFMHFKSRTTAGAGDGLDKIRNLVRILAHFQGKSKLYTVPFEDFQREIIMNISSKNRMVVYRRMMIRIAQMIAIKEDAKAIIVGDSIGQVASQTIENIDVAYRVSHMPIISPLIGFNKQETIDVAKKIGTYEISIIPYSDCCSLIASKHPETKAQLREIEKQEKNMNVDVILENIKPKLKIEVII